MATVEKIDDLTIHTDLNGAYHTPSDLILAKSITDSSMPPLPQSAYLPDELSHGASPWLDSYVRFSRKWSPRAYDAFHESVGMWLLSTTAARRVCLNMGKKRYTNLYIALAARTSIYAKSTTTEIAQSVMKEAGLLHLLAPDDTTPQAFVRSMSRFVPDEWFGMSERDQNAIKNKLAFASQRGWFFDEFGQKISAMMRDGGHMADFRGLLRKFDDTPDLYEYVTIGRGSDLVHCPYLALLVNFTPADLKPYAEKGSALWNDGFWARYAFLTPPSGYERPRGRFPEGERIIPSELVSQLRNWHYRLGIPEVEIKEVENEYTGKSHIDISVTNPGEEVCEMDDGVRNAFYNYNDALIDIVEQSEYSDLDGNYTRLPEKALRVSMLIASMENDGLIEMKHWAKGQQMAESWRENLHNLYHQVTQDASKGKILDMEEKIMKLIADKGPLSKRDIYTFTRGLDSGQAGIILTSMCNTELLESFKDGRKEFFKLAG